MRLKKSAGPPKRKNDKSFASDCKFYEYLASSEIKNQLTKSYFASREFDLKLQRDFVFLFLFI
jgi:hypothetical protein